MNNPCNDLLACKACGKPVGALAETCPGCGTPNDWLHPAIQTMVNNAGKISTSHPFTFQYKKASVWGETKSFHTPLSLIILVVVLAVGMLTSLFFFIGAFFVFLIGFLVVPRLKRKESFQTDLSAETWNSSNDVFWKPVIDMLGVEKK